MHLKGDDHYCLGRSSLRLRMLDLMGKRAQTGIPTTGKEYQAVAASLTPQTEEPFSGVTTDMSPDQVAEKLVDSLLKVSAHINTT